MLTIEDALELITNGEDAEEVAVALLESVYSETLGTSEVENEEVDSDEAQDNEADAEVD